jgi:hypothetical protein
MNLEDDDEDKHHHHDDKHDDDDHHDDSYRPSHVFTPRPDSSHDNSHSAVDDILQGIARIGMGLLDSKMRLLGDMREVLTKERFKPTYGLDNDHKDEVSVVNGFQLYCVVIIESGFFYPSG